MSNELVVPRILRCPSDQKLEIIKTFENFAEGKSSYVMVTPGAPEGSSNIVFIRCTIHGHVAYTDGSVLHGDGSAFPGKQPLR